MKEKIRDWYNKGHIPYAWMVYGLAYCLNMTPGEALFQMIMNCESGPNDREEQEFVRAD